MDEFDRKDIKPMLIKDQMDAFDSKDYIYELKLDGIRCVAYLDSSGTDLRNKREKALLKFVPELSEIHKQVKEKCILDGELFILKGGITDFYEIQRRVLMSDPFKIKIAASQYPACYVAYDILYLKDHLVNDLTLMDRKQILSGILKETKEISISRYIETDGINLYELAKKSGLEGIVAKKKDSKYYFDKRTKDWIKCKVMASDDCVICGYIEKENHTISLILGQYDEHKLVYKGHVSSVSPSIFEHQKYKIIEDSPFGYLPNGNEDAIWMEPELVCIVESMPTDKNSFRQPVFKGLRDDKMPYECKI